MICRAFLQQNEAVHLKSEYAAVAAITKQRPIMVITGSSVGVECSECMKVLGHADWCSKRDS